MNSINSDTDLSTFINAELIPLMEKLRREGKTYFPVRAYPGLMSYYVERKTLMMVKEDFEIAGCDSPDNLLLALANLWTEQNCPELIPLAKSLANLAGSLHIVEEQTEEVSPFIYVMF